jgi:hypothetical protein
VTRRLLEDVARREARVWDLTFFLTLGWIVFGALPLLGILILSLVFGNFPTDADPSPEGYPAFTPPWWAMYPLVGVQIWATVLAFPLPLRGRRWGTRSGLALQSVAVVLFTFMNGTVAWGREGTFYGTDWLGILSLVCLLALVLRMVAGYLRLVPRSWREYVDADGRVVDPREVPRPAARPWDGVSRLIGRARR